MSEKILLIFVVLRDVVLMPSLKNTLSIIYSQEVHKMFANFKKEKINQVYNNNNGNTVFIKHLIRHFSIISSFLEDEEKKMTQFTKIRYRTHKITKRQKVFFLLNFMVVIFLGVRQVSDALCAVHMPCSHKNTF